MRQAGAPARRGIALAGMMLLAMMVAGCNDEPAERKAFIGFLQTRIIDKPGIHVPHLTPEESKSFGDYAKQYAVITDFNDGMDRSVVKPLAEAVDHGAIRSLNDVVTRHADFVAARDGIVKLRGAIDQQLAAADAAHAALKQPDDLKPVFDKAYERDVTIPAKAFAEIFPDLSGALTAIVDLGDFIQQHKNAVTINGSHLETTDATLQPQLTALVDAVIAKNEAIEKAQDNLRSVLNGS